MSSQSLPEVREAPEMHLAVYFSILVWLKQTLPQCHGEVAWIVSLCGSGDSSHLLKIMFLKGLMLISRLKVGARKHPFHAITNGNYSATTRGILDPSGSNDSA